MIGFIDAFFQSLLFKEIITAHNLWLSNTGSVPYWTISAFSSAVTDLDLIYESLTSSASVVRWLALHSWTMNFGTAFWILLRLTD
jgi:hypothetical protein